MAIPSFKSADPAQFQIEDKTNDIDLARLAWTVWRGKYVIALCALIAVIFGIWYAYFKIVPTYTASASVMLENRQEQVVALDSVVSGLSGDQITVNTEVEVMRSRGLIEKVVLELDLLSDPEFNGALRPPTFSIRGSISKARVAVTNMLTGGPAPAGTPDAAATAAAERRVLDAVIDGVLARIVVSNVRQSYVFRITASSQSPAKAALLANTLSEVYINEQLEAKFLATDKATIWLTGRVADLQVQLERAEEAVKDFNADADLVSPQALNGLNRQIKDLRERLVNARQTEAQSTARLEALRGVEQERDPAKIAQVAGDATLSRILNEGSSPLLGLQRQRFWARFDDIIERTQIDQVRAANQADALAATITAQEEQIDRQSDDLVRLQQLQREAEASRLIYEFFLNRLKETSVQEGIQQADSRMLSQAVVPRYPSAPRKSLILAASLLLGAIAGTLFILAREAAQNTFRDAKQLEDRTGHTVLGQIPVIPSKQRKSVLQYFIDKPTSAAAEAVRNLRTSILLSDIDNPPKVIMSTSSVPGEGKSTQSLALTQNLTGLGKKVLLIEGDIRKRVFAEYFQIDKEQGLLSVLSGKATLEEAATFVPMLGADVLIGEKSEVNAADVYSSNRFREQLDVLREKYDYIIIDTPPVLAVPDARVIGQWVDAIVYAVKWDSTTHRQVREGLAAFDSVNVKVSGLVLSQIDGSKMKGYGLGESYGAYSSYYDS